MAAHTSVIRLALLLSLDNIKSPKLVLPALVTLSTQPRLASLLYNAEMSFIDLFMAAPTSLRHYAAKSEASQPSMRSHYWYREMAGSATLYYPIA